MQLLMDHGNPQLRRSAAVRDLDNLSIHLDLAGVSVVEPEQAPHQCRLAGAVLSHQCVNATGPNIDGNVIQRLDTGEVLADVLQS